MKTSSVVLLVILGFIIVVGGCAGCSAVGFKNNTVGLDQEVQNKWGAVQSDYQRRADLIPNLVNTVKGEANFEKSTLEGVIQARASATQIKVDASDLTPEKLQQYQAAQGQLSQALGRLLAVSENYPTLQSNAAFQGLQTQLEGTENRIKVSRNDFNDAVKAYDTQIQTFPNSLYAGWFGYKLKAYFQADAGAEHAPNVNFSDSSK
jgi:LemA protein